jgi:putative tricarboxylic transport membrane protein
MDLFHSIVLGFQVTLQPENILFCLIGVVIGTLVGILPGFGPAAAISLLLPVTFHVTPVSAIIMLAGIYYGAMYGGSTTSILVNIPGEAASVVTCLDGYQMARKGRAGAALGISAIGSFVAGTIGVIGLMIMAPLLAEVALKFGPPEYFSLMILGLTILTFLASGSMWNALLMAAFGLFVGSIGVDPLVGLTRFTFDVVELSDGVGLIPVVMGLFGVAEVLLNIEQSLDKRDLLQTKILNLLPNLQDFFDSFWPIIRGTIVGFFLGILPGGGAAIASFMSYALEKRISKHPELFGTGMIAGVAGPESANNAATGGAFIPLLTLGIPSNAVMAILLGALMLHGISPGPAMISEHPDLFWGVIASMYLGNLILLILNLPMIGIWVKILKIPYPILFPLILLFCIIGVYSLNSNVVEVLIMIVFGVIGYVLKKFNYEAAPLVLALILGPIMETSLRRSLMLSYGNPMIFLTRPISAVLLVISILLLILSILPWVRKKKADIPLEDELA